MRVQSLGWGDPLQKRMVTHSSTSCLKGCSEFRLQHFLPELSHWLPGFSVIHYSGASQVVLVVKNPPAITGDIRDSGSTPGSGRCPGGENGNPLQYSCLGNPKDGGDWRATVQEVGQNLVTEQQGILSIWGAPPPPALLLACFFLLERTL